MPLAAVAAIGAIGSVAGGALAAHGAGKQADAATAAANLQHQDAQSALQFQKDQWSTQQKNEAPWLKAGQGAVTSLSDLMNNGGFPDWTGKFQAPTAATEQNDPGFQFRLQQGQQALERSAAAKGGLLSGGTGKALQQYGQDYASNEYSNVYNRALGQYQQGYNEFQNNQTNRYNRLAGLAGLGQTSANQLGQSGQAASGNISNILLNSGQQIGNSLQNAAAARASGYTAIGNGINSGASSLMDLYMLQKMMPQAGNNPSSILG